MSKSSRVSFSLAPLVHLYKRRIALSEPPSPVQSPVIECTTPKNIIVHEHRQEQSPKPTLTLSVCGFEQYRAEPSPLPPQPPPPLNLFALSISVPKQNEQPIETDDVPVYDKSPLSPGAHHEINLQRAHEKEACANALEQALVHFHMSVTPPWHRTPASVRSMTATPSMSPLNLTPRADLPLLPMSPENSFTGLDTMVSN